MRHRILVFVALVALVTACDDAVTAPAVPQTLAEASKRYDEAILALNWAQQDLHRLGSRDRLAGVIFDTSIAPYYVRVPFRP